MVNLQESAPAETDLSELLTRARKAQRVWAETELQRRLQVVREIRSEIARSASSLLQAFPRQLRANAAERLVSELIPLAEACRFLEQEAGRILAPRRLTRKSAPLWLRGVSVYEYRDPIGVVLVIGPANYPLFLPAVQALQALTAGNAVIIKPGLGGASVVNTFHEIALRAGVPPDCMLVLDEASETAQTAIHEGVDKVVLTGSVETGRAVYRTAAGSLIPVTLELSGCDPVFILSGADLERGAAAITFGVRWNNGDTCIAPRRIFVAESVAETLEVLLERKCPEAAGLLPIIRFGNEEEALAMASRSPFALGASVFGGLTAAQNFASKVRAGVVVVNDVIMPTADPRVAFGGRGQSGFGITRGAEGLRQFTAPKAVVVQRAKRLRHLEPLPERAEDIFRAYLSLSHARRWRERIRALVHLFHVLQMRGA